MVYVLTSLAIVIAEAGGDVHHEDPSIAPIISLMILGASWMTSKVGNRDNRGLYRDSEEDGNYYLGFRL